MGAHQRLDRRRVDPGEGGLRKSARRSESVLTLLTFPRFYLGKRPRRESNSHLRFRKPPFYPLNYGDGRKGKVERLKDKIQRVDFALRISSLYWRHRKFSRARDRRRSRRSFTKSFDSPCGSFNIPK